MATGKIATAYVQIAPSMEGVAPKVKQYFGDAGTDSGASFGSNLMGKIKNLILISGIGKILTEAIMAGADTEQNLGGIETLFKDSADTVIANAETAYKRAGLSANDYMETVTGFSASLLQSVGGDTVEAASIADMAVTDMSDNANKFGSDIVSIQNAYQGFAKQNYTMLDNLKLGYGGTKSEMERLLADAQKLTGIKYDISNLDDVYTAIHVIQSEMEISGRTAEECAEIYENTGRVVSEHLGATAQEASITVSGSLASMKAAFSNLLSDLAMGNDLSDSLWALSETVFTFVKNLLPMVGDILAGLPEVLDMAFSIAVRGLNLTTKNADTILQQGVELVTALGNSIISAVPYLIEAAFSLVAALGNAIISTDWNQVAQSAMGDLKYRLDLAAGEILGTDGNIVQSVLDAISSGLPDLLEGGVTIVSELANGLLEGLPGFIESAGELLLSLYDLLWGATPDVWNSGMELVSNLASGLIDNLPAIVGAAVDLIADFLATFASHLPEILEQGYTLVGEMVAGLISAIPDVLAAAIEIIGGIFDTFGQTDWLSLGSDIVDGIVNGIINAAGAIWDAMVDLADQAIEAAKEALDIHSPSRRFRKEVGRQIPPGVALGVEDNTGIIENAMNDLSDTTTDSFVSGLRMDMGKAKVSNSKNNGVAGKVVNVVQNIYSEAKTAADLMQEAQYQQERAVLLGV